jgi:acetyl-CoA carboxylase biotin carboxyl carrier protein
MSPPVRPDEIGEIIQAFEEAGFAELHIRFEGFELHLGADGDVPAVSQLAAPAAPPVLESRAAAALAPPAATAVGEAELVGLEIVRAPYLGTFYSAPKPGAPAYVEVGAVVGPDTDVCLIEVMKLFTAVRAGVHGVMERVLARDGAMVEAEQPLFAIRPGT